MSTSEKQIMEILWSTGHPITTREIMSNLPVDNTWKQNTIVTFLARLMEKGIINATRVSKANYYQPCITEKEYRDFETKQFIDDIHKGSTLGFISTLCDNGTLTKEDIEELMRNLKK
ncbi:BlaI/MecI/CopY family transcriptional regulator [Fusibacter sp. 3D3]|uniref:BlaI/MecI/CopY family transcriptional regulator n=1 Tax=Fusibacter sp. 3D3 TaxID=1048380 RepID=UPI001FA7CECA|nr:BlaI/MecI/CopY family transcriptional regulator [Fusibacter sp. 3D3]